MSYGRTDLNAMQEAAKKANGEGFWYSVPEKGDKGFLCPPWNSEQKLPYKEILVHYNVGQEKIFCLKNFGLACPICQANDELFGMKTNAAAQELSKKIYAKKSFLYNIIPGVDVQMVNGTEGIAVATNPQTKIKPFAMGIKLHKMILFYLPQCGDVFDPTGGRVFDFRKMNNGGDPKFAQTFASPSMCKVRLSEPLLALLNNMPDLDKEVKMEDAGKLKGMVDLLMVNFRASTGTASVGFNPAVPPPAGVTLPPNAFPSAFGNTFPTPPAAPVTATQVVPPVNTVPTTPPAAPVATTQPPLSSPLNPQSVMDMEAFIKARQAQQGK